MADVIDMAAWRDRRAREQRNAALLPETWPDHVLMDLIERIDEADPGDVVDVMLEFQRDQDQ